MKKILYTLISLVIIWVSANAQKGIDFSRSYPAGGKLLMYVDSSATNVYYWNIFPNQPQTSFNYLPDIHQIAIQIYFRKSINVARYRYTILVNDKPLQVNQPVNPDLLKDADMPDGILRSAQLGHFKLKGKIITTLVYNIDSPLQVEKSVFYGKPIPRPKITAIEKSYTTDKDTDYEHVVNPKNTIHFALTEKDDELIVVKERSDIDYLYKTTITDKQTHQVVFESSSWQYGGIIDEKHAFSPYVRINKSVFKKSGDYEVVIQPSVNWLNCSNCNMSAKDIQQFTATYTLAISKEEQFSIKQLIFPGILFSLIVGGITGSLTVYIKNQQIKKKVAAEALQKEIVQLKLNSVRSQLNPHFLFNALAGIQNLMNKNELDQANRYLSKFARLTRSVLNSQELIPLTGEKTLLDDYLQMEQLRFGFNYSIQVSPALDMDNTEIPSMLLQPFVENAVKHGITAKGNNGKIDVYFEKQSSDLILKIADNGNGFSREASHTGLGLTLSRDRISLLNTLYKDTPFVLDIQSGQEGTTITITLTQWLS